MDDTFDTNKRGLLRPIASVVVITLMTGFFFSAPQTYALGTNGDIPVTLDQAYQQTTNLSNFVKKVFNFFSESSSPSSHKENTLLVDNNKPECKKEWLLPFLDIQDSEYKDYIMALYFKGIVVWSTNKFMPKDDLRFYWMIKIIVDAYRSRVWYDIKTQLWLSQKNYFLDAWSDIDKSFLKYLNTAYELWLLQWIDDFDVSSNIYFQKNVSYNTIKQIFMNINKQFPLLWNWSEINQMPDLEDYISRWEYSKYVVNYFEFKVSNIQSSCSGDWKNSFSDIMNHDYKEDIQVLADLWIINPQAYKFYPDNYLRNYEFIIMLTKTILKKENQDLNIYVLDHTANISDLDSQASYTKYFEYAYHNWFLDYGFDPQTWKPTVHPNGFVTVQEINHILSKLVDKEVSFEVESKEWLVTRWEFAEMLVDWFDLGYGLDSGATNVVEEPVSETSFLQEIWWRLQSAKLLSKL